MKRSTSASLVLVIVALIVFWFQVQTTTLITVGDGHGWDGGKYASMLTSGFSQGTANPQLRPLVILLNWPAYLANGDAVQTFALMNYVYLAVLALFVGLLTERYAGGSSARAVFVVNMVLTIALAKMFAYYPVLIDLGAYAVVSAAVYCAVRGPGPVTALACVAAVLARRVWPGRSALWDAPRVAAGCVMDAGSSQPTRPPVQRFSGGAGSCSDRLRLATS